ncbi:hypothetical protein [Streptomyces sp. NPDC001770]
MDEVPWFEYEEDDLDVARRAFVDALAERARSWQVDPRDTVVLPPAHIYAVRYEHAGTGQGLGEGFEDALAPDAPRKGLATDGVIRGRNRINRAGLGAGRT